jgi:hypothetical protein
MALASRFTGLASRTTLNRAPVARFTGLASQTTLNRAPAGTLGPQSVSTPAGPTGPSTPPPDPVYLATVAGNQSSHDITAADLARDRKNAFLNYGYTQDAAGNLTFDPTNPFSQAALLKRSYDQAQTGNTNSYAARGQLYSGALQNAQNESGFQYQAGSDRLTKALTDFLARNTSAAGQNDTSLELANGQAAGASLQAAPDNPLYQPDGSAPAAPTLSAQDAANLANGGTPTIQTNYRAPSGKIGTLKTYPNGRKVFIPN